MLETHDLTKRVAKGREFEGIGTLKNHIQFPGWLYVIVANLCEEQLQSQLEVQLREEFFKTQEGQDILQQLSVLMSPDVLSLN